MKALQLQGVHQTRGIPNDKGSRRMEVKEGVPTALGNQSCPIRDRFSACDMRLNKRMAFPFSKQLMEMSGRVLIVDCNCQTHGNVGFIHMIDKPAPIEAQPQRKPEGVQDGSWGVRACRNFN